MTDLDDALRDGVVERVRLVPLGALALRYSGTEREARVASALLGFPLERGPGGSISLSCPVSDEPGREVTLRPGLVVVRFDGPEFRFAITDPYPFGFMYERDPGVSGEHGHD